MKRLSFGVLLTLSTTACSIYSAGDSPAAIDASRASVDAAVANDATSDDASPPSAGSLWIEITSSQLPTGLVDGAAIAFDPIRGNTIFHGYNDYNAQMETWRWDGHSWTQLAPAHPPQEDYDPLMVFDRARGTIFSYAGGGAWSWDGSDWSALSPSGAMPSGRSATSIAYDPVAQQTILYGGNILVEVNEGAYYTGAPDEMWAWDGSSWSQLISANGMPTANNGVSMCFDEAHDQLVLFGGNRFTDDGQSQDLNETWLWDGTSWSHVAPAVTPPAETSASFTYDATIGQCVLFGIASTGTWAWNGTTWTELSSVGPSVVEAVITTYDSTSGRIRLLGTPGDDPNAMSSVMWEFIDGT